MQLLGQIVHTIFDTNNHNNERHTRLNIIKNIDCRLLDLTETVLRKTVLFGNSSLDTHTNT